MHITRISLLMSILWSLATTVQGNPLQQPAADAATGIGTSHLLLISSFNTIKKCETLETNNLPQRMYTEKI